MRARAIPGMVLKDLRRDLRQPLGILLTLAFPLLFAGLLAVTFGGGDGPPPRVELLVQDLDDDLVSNAVLAAFGAEEMATHFDVRQVGDDGPGRIERGEASALLRIPAGFTAAYLRGEPTALELVRNPAQGILPEVAEQISASLAEVLSAGSFVLREPLERLDRLRADPETAWSASSFTEVAASAGGAIETASSRLFPPAITLEVGTLAAPDGAGAGGNAGFGALFLSVLPGIAVFALFMIGDQVMRDILVEQDAGTLRRQLAGPLGAGTVVAGKVAHTAVVACLALVILSLSGWLAAGRSIDALGFAALALALIVAVTGTAALIYGLARNQRQGATLASVVYMVFAFVGGSFIRTDGLPALLQRMAPFTPFHWANRGFETLLHDGGGLVDVLPRIGLLAAFGLVGVLAGSRLLNARLLRASA